MLPAVKKEPLLQWYNRQTADPRHCFKHIPGYYCKVSCKQPKMPSSRGHLQEMVTYERFKLWYFVLGWGYMAGCCSTFSKHWMVVLNLIQTSFLLAPLPWVPRLSSLYSSIDQIYRLDKSPSELNNSMSDCHSFTHYFCFCFWYLLEVWLYHLNLYKRNKINYICENNSRFQPIL